MSGFFDVVLDAFEGILAFLHAILEPITGVNAWGWSIVALTLVVRVLLLPLAIKQTRSMRAMQAIQPEMKALQKKYKVDRELMRKDPEQYRAKRAKLNEEMMALYKREGANPAASCLPLLAQAPIFIALFWTLNLDRKEVFSGAPFYFFTEFISAESRAEGITGLATQVSQAGWPGWLLIVLMSGTMYWTQRQMMARTAAQQGGDNPMAQQQKILLYVMPIFLAVISFQFPLGVLLYWVTTNVWQVAQQAIILREVKAEQAAGPKAKGGEDAAEPPRRSPGASSGKKPVPKQPKDGDASSGSGKAGAGGKGSGKASGSGKGSDQGSGKGSSGAASGKGAGKGSGKGAGKGSGKGAGKGATSGKGTTSGKGSEKGTISGGGSGKATTSGRGSGKDPGQGSGKGSGKGSGSSNGQGPGAKGSGNGSSTPRRSSKRDHIPRRRQS